MSKRNNLFIFILTLGVFGILNTEMGVIGILPQIAEQFNVSVSQAGLLVSLFALAVAISGPILPLVFSRFNRRGVMLLVLGVFVISNIFSIFATNFTFAIIARVIPAFLHPVYISIALTAAASSVSEKEIPKAVSKVIMGVSAGIVLGVPITTFIASIASIDAAMTFCYRECSSIHWCIAICSIHACQRKAFIRISTTCIEESNNLAIYCCRYICKCSNGWSV